MVDNLSSPFNDPSFQGGSEREQGQSEGDFLELRLDRYKPVRFPKPLQLDVLLKKLERSRMLILSGEVGVSLTDLARHVASEFREHLFPNPAGESTLLVQEWRRSADPQRLLVRLQSPTPVTIFLLAELSPRDLNVPLHDLQDKAQGHYLIISTRTPFDEWDLPAPTADNFWYELPKSDLFPTDGLAEALNARLLELQEKHTLPPGLTLTGSDPTTTPICGTLTLLEISQRLETLTRVQAFVSAVQGREEEMTEERVRTIVDTIVSKDTIGVADLFHYWFHFRLDKRGRTLALTLSFFDGLFEDQFFAALEYLFNQTWRTRDPALSAFDYDDLEPLDLFFELVVIRSGARVVQGVLPGQRRMLLNEAWLSQRRQIVASLPYLATLVKQSVDFRSLDRELYGSRTRRERLREAISLTLSDIGLIDEDAIRPALIELAADRNIGVQLVAATAMARWRYHGEHQKLFRMLQAWQRDSYITELFRAILESREEQAGLRPESFIRATVALTVGQAERYDQPNELAPQLVELFIDLSDDLNPLVRAHFRAYTLPRIAARHHKQLEDALRDMVRADELLFPVANGLAQGYQVSPADVLTIVERWHEEGNRTRPPRINPDEVSPRESLLATVARTYGAIEYQPPAEGTQAATHGATLTAEQGFNRLQQLLREEPHPYVRRAVVLALANQAKHDFEAVEPLLARCISVATEAEQDDIIAIFTALYRKQRADLEGGNERVTLENRSYPIWLDPRQRPLTTIERVMEQWVRRPHNKVAQRVAMKATIAFAKAVEQPLADQVRQLQEKAAQSAAEANNTEAQIQQTLIPSTPQLAQAKQSWWYAESLIPWLVSWDNPVHRQTIANLLPEVARHKRLVQLPTTFVLERWVTSTDPALREVGRRLTTGLSWIENQLLLLLILGGLVLMTGCGLLSALT